MSGTPTGPDDPTVPMGGGADPGGPPAEDPDPWYARPAVFIPLALVIVLVAVLVVTTLGGDDGEVAEEPGDDPADEPADDPAEDAPDPDGTDPDAPVDDPAGDDPATDGADPADPADDLRDPPAELGEATSTFVVALSWEHEVDELADPPAFDQGQEGATGSAWLWLNADEGIICADLVVEGLDPADSFEAGPGAHLHVGGADDNGPVVVVFDTPDDETGESSGCYREFEDGLDPVETLQEVEQDPANWYVNVHSEAYPMGVVRGQLFGGERGQTGQ